MKGIRLFGLLAIIAILLTLPSTTEAQTNIRTYSFTMPSGDSIAIGRTGATNFEPYLRMYRWGTECWMQLGPPTIGAVAVAGNTRAAISGSTLTWTTAGGSFRWYLKPAADGDLGSIEFEVIFTNKPITNSIVFPFSSQGLEFFYQPPEVSSKGIPRPDNVIGSYAVYRSVPPIYANSADASKYLGGKAFHIWRPTLTDSKGNWIWGVLTITSNTFTLSWDDAWMASATYPVTLGPNYGYTSVAGTWTEYFNTGECFVAELGSISENGTLNYLHWALANAQAPVTAKSAFYSDSSDQPNTRLSYDTNTFTCSDTSNPGTFFTTTGNYSLSLTSGTSYWAAVGNGSSGDMYVGYDTATGYEGYFDNLTTPPATWTDFTYGALTNKRFSVYTEYTASGGGGATKHYGFVF